MSFRPGIQGLRWCQNSNQIFVFKCIPLPDGAPVNNRWWSPKVFAFNSFTRKPRSGQIFGKNPPVVDGPGRGIRLRGKPALGRELKGEERLEKPALINGPRSISVKPLSFKGVFRFGLDLPGLPTWALPLPAPPLPRLRQRGRSP